MADEQKVLTQQDIDNAVAAKDKEWNENFTKKVNEASKAERIKYEKQLETAKLSETERLVAEAKEEKQRLIDENNSLKQEKAMTTKKSLLSDSKLPSHYINDVRLIDAKDEDEAKSVIKIISKEHNDFLASINKVSQTTSPQVGSTTIMTTEQLAELAEKDPIAYRKIRAEQLKNGGR